MLMSINIGNFDISVGVFQASSFELFLKFKLSTDPRRTSDEYQMLINSILHENQIDTTKIGGAIISSVVPQLTDTISETVEKIVGKTPLIVGPGVKTGFSIKIDNPSELGGDIVANAAAVVHIQKTNGKNNSSIIVDVGTATTISAIKNGEYIGCAICPGIKMSCEAMHGSTAQLPNVACSSPDSAIGKNSRDSVLSGVVIGNAIMLDGFVFRFMREMRCRAEDVDLYITGEHAERVIPFCKSEFLYEKELTLQGLCRIYANSHK